MAEKRPYYPTKAAWAEAQAKELREGAHALRFQRSGSTGRARRKFASIDTIAAEAARFDGMAARFKARGL